MKQLLFAPIFFFLISACDQPKNPVAEYGDAMINSYQKGKQAGETGNLDAVKKAVQAYHAANDKYPQSLEEIKGMIGSEMDISKYDYDPQTGEVRLKNK
ncbi:MAG: hypothetical protein HY755_01500 [Nitrospirae bacterium]|nr:hypothetical protein [Nitrospirota bacterium]